MPELNENRPTPVEPEAQQNVLEKVATPSDDTREALESLLEAVEDQRLREALGSDYFQEFGQQMGALRSPTESSGRKADLYNQYFDGLVLESAKDLLLKLRKNSSQSPANLRTLADQLTAAKLTKLKNLASQAGDKDYLSLADLRSHVNNDPDVGRLTSVVTGAVETESSFDKAKLTRDWAEYLRETMTRLQSPAGLEETDRQALADRTKLAASLLRLRDGLGHQGYQEVLAGALSGLDPALESLVSERQLEQYAKDPYALETELRRLRGSVSPETARLLEFFVEQTASLGARPEQAQSNLGQALALSELRALEKQYGDKTGNWLASKDCLTDIVVGAGLGFAALLAVPGVLNLAGASPEKGFFGKAGWLLQQPGVWGKVGLPLLALGGYFWRDELGELVSDSGDKAQDIWKQVKSKNIIEL